MDPMMLPTPLDPLQLSMVSTEVEALRRVLLFQSGFLLLVSCSNVGSHQVLHHVPSSSVYHA